ncbi:hypothetical protein BDR04DRAFT_1110852 [Suillus decipiens]|nr:hypothetical protein BDR04DRAFT_1110852 [Suillus decipiens]
MSLCAFEDLDHNQWLHLAHHGIPNRNQLFEPSFATCDGPLTINDQGCHPIRLAKLRVRTLISLPHHRGLRENSQ